MRLVFDRGTLLLAGASALDRLADLPGLRWDPRVRAYRAPAWRHAEVASALAGAGVRFADEVRAPVAAPARWRPVSLRPYQHEALEAWAQAELRGVVALPTGSGKTRVGLAAMARLQRPALVVVPTRVLLDQWCAELATVYPDAIGRYGDGARDLSAVTVATYESAYRHMATLGDRFELIVIDEAHHFGAGMRDELLEMCAAPARLGLTATPAAGPAAEVVERLVGPTIYQLTVADLAGTFLADFELVTLPVELDAVERARHDQLMAQFRVVHAEFQRGRPDAPWREFAAAAQRSLDGRRALRAWREARRLVSLGRDKRRAIGELLARHRDARVLIFTADNDAAYAVARDHLVMPLTCDIGRSERAEALERFRRGELRALVSARVLNEGLDVPDAEVAIVAGGSLGEREHTQRVGRLLRPAPGKRAVVYELVTRSTTEVAQSRRRRKGLGPRHVAGLSRPG